MAENDGSESWSLLPDEVVESILQQLPSDTIARFRRVCSEWNNLLSSEYFLTWRRKNFKEHPWLLLIRKLPNDGPKYYRLNVLTKSLKPFPLDPMVLASVGGLVVRTDIERNRLFLCNPLTGTEAQISRGGRLFRERSVTVCNPVSETFFQFPVTALHRNYHGIRVGNILWEANQYHLVVVYTNYIEVYDFANQSRIIQRLPRGLRTGELVFFKGFYFYTMMRFGDHNEWHIMRFGINSHTQNQFWRGRPPLRKPHLVVCGSALVLIAQRSLSLSLYLYDDNPDRISNSSWKLMVEMPQEEVTFLFPDLNGSFKYKSLAVGNYICFIRQSSGKLVFFNKENRSWSRFSVSDELENFTGCVDAYVYEPRPDIWIQ